MVFNKIFKKKNDGFYLQVEDDTPAAAATKTAPAAPPVEAAPAPKAEETPSASQAEQTPTAPKADKKIEKKSKKVEQKAAPAPAPVVAAAPAPAPAPVVIKNFAPDYLIKPSSNNSRRRPGANMNMYLDMARQVKTPTNK